MKALESAAAAIARMQERVPTTTVSPKAAIIEAKEAPVPKKKAVTKKAAAKKTAAKKPPEKRRVLLVDGDSAERARKALEGEAGVIVETTPLAERALELAVQQDYALMVIAMDLPECSGEFLYEMVQLFYRHEKRERYIPAVAYIADAFSEDMAGRLRRDARVKGLIERPVTRKNMREVVGTVAALKGEKCMVETENTR